ncbi:MAG: hypothetical protein U9P00_11315 [Pseudomonadota bacterium]|nr:hypothetical protein [Pseudomonadota bacterium]
MSFKPNKLRPRHVDDLEDWELLVAACHYGPAMGDCIKLDYGYKIEEDFLGDTDIFCDGHSLVGDIDINNPMEALEGYAGFTWQSGIREHLKKILEEYWDEEEDEREIT